MSYVTSILAEFYFQVPDTDCTTQVSKGATSIYVDTFYSHQWAAGVDDVDDPPTFMMLMALLQIPTVHPASLGGLTPGTVVLLPDGSRPCKARSKHSGEAARRRNMKLHHLQCVEPPKGFNVSTQPVR